MSDSIKYYESPFHVTHRKEVADRTAKEIDDEIMNQKTCKQLHTKCPIGYIEWHDWAVKKMKTHDQKKCPNCGDLSIWYKKK